jgi:hypothetical protein
LSKFIQMTALLFQQEIVQIHPDDSILFLRFQLDLRSFIFVLTKLLDRPVISPPSSLNWKCFTP